MGTTDIFILMGLPGTLCSALVGLLVWRLKAQITENKKQQDAHEHARLQYETHIVKTLNATAALSEAVAVALQNGKCNGETHRALEYMQQVKHEQRDFLTSHGIADIYNS